MGKLKKIYILILLLLLVVSSAAYFSYAYFVSRNEEHGKLNIVAGELKYKIESDSLENNQLTLAANETKDLEINITSLNEIDSKYELYYTSTNDVTIYYDSEYELPTGTITSKSTKTIKVQIVNNSDSEATVIFGVQGGLVNHTLSLNQGNKIDTAIPTCQYAVGEVVGTFDYTGSPEEFTAQCDGIYKLEVWGAQGGTYSGGIGGKGGYSSGKVSLTENSSLFVVVGGTGGVIFSSKGNASAGYNGGGQGTSYGQQGNIGTSGGGATHIAMGTTNRGELKNYKDYISELLIIAGGGGGVGNNSLSMNKNGGTGGGLSGGSSSDGNTSVGTQTSGYSFGLGGNGVSYESGSGGGGGGGLYGGYGGWNMGSGTGGSGYIGGVTDGTTENGVRSGNGYAQITYLGENTSYNIGDAVTLTDGSKWHVLEENGNDSKTVTLLSDYNLNPSMTNSSDMYNTTCSSTDYTSCSIAFDPNNTNEYDVNDSNNIGYFMTNTYAKNLLEVLPETTNITLPTAGQIASADNQDFNNQLMYLNSSWLLSTNYWTTTKVENTTDNIWIVYGHASAINTGSPQGAGYAGARPVITVPKKYISN